MSDRISASPMEFVVRLDCVGVVEIAKLRAAVLAELKRQPLLQANATVGETHRQSFWRHASNCTPQIQWYEGNPDHGSGFPENFVPIDLENEIGFRFYGWRFSADGQPRIVMKFVYHHACCDGKGGLGFVENTFQRYQSLLNNESAPPSDLAPVDENQILSRNLPGKNKLGPIDRIWNALVIRPKRVGNMLLVKPRLFSENGEISNESEIFANPPQQCSTELSVAETEQLGVLAKKLSASTNTILARSLFHAVSDYFKPDSKLANNDNAKSNSGEGDAGRSFRILIPFSLRDERHKHMPAANCVSMAYLEANEKDLENDNSDDGALVSDLARQVSFIRRWNLQYSWIDSVDMYSKIWPIIRIFKSRRKRGARNMVPVATTVMTNLGRVFSGSKLINSEGEVAVGGLVVKSVHVAPPCNATVLINFSINFYGDRLTLDANSLPSSLDQKSAERILGSWKRQIIDSIAGQ